MTRIVLSTRSRLANYSVHFIRKMESRPVLLILDWPIQPILTTVDLLQWYMHKARTHVLTSTPFGYNSVWSEALRPRVDSVPPCASDVLHRLGLGTILKYYSKTASQYVFTYVYVVSIPKGNKNSSSSRSRKTIRHKKIWTKQNPNFFAQTETVMGLTERRTPSLHPM